MNMTMEQIVDEALAPPSEARALLADRLVEILDSADDGTEQQLWARETILRRNEIRSGRVLAEPGEEPLARVRRAIGQ